MAAEVSIAFQQEQVVLEVVATSLTPDQGFPLAGNGTYTGTSRSASGLARLVGLVFTDQAGNISIEQSIDGSNWDLVTTTGVVANTALAINQTLTGKWVRVVYVNGATPQTLFRAYLATRPL